MVRRRGGAPPSGRWAAIAYLDDQLPAQFTPSFFCRLLDEVVY
jgi:hypothetical protein